jgi:hypothetical protein
MTTHRTAAAYVMVAIVALDLTAEVLRLGVCLAQGPGPAQAACYQRIGPVSQAFHALKLTLTGGPPPAAPVAPTPAPPAAPAQPESRTEQRRTLRDP